MAQERGSAAATDRPGDPKLKLSVVLDPTLETELRRLPTSTVRAMFSNYKKTRGGNPSEDIEPTLEQLSAVHQVLTADLLPYADFALLGPHGRRLLQKLTYDMWTFCPDGQWARRELPGPPTFEHWWSSYRVLRTIFIMLNVVDVEIIDSYGEMVRGFIKTYGEVS